MRVSAGTGARVERVWKGTGAGPWTAGTGARGAARAGGRGSARAFSLGYGAAFTTSNRSSLSFRIPVVTPSSEPNSSHWSASAA